MVKPNLNGPDIKKSVWFFDYIKSTICKKEFDFIDIKLKNQILMSQLQMYVDGSWLERFLCQYKLCVLVVRYNSNSHTSVLLLMCCRSAVRWHVSVCRCVRVCIRWLFWLRFYTYFEIFIWRSVAEQLHAHVNHKKITAKRTKKSGCFVLVHLLVLLMTFYNIFDTGFS